MKIKTLFFCILLIAGSSRLFAQQKDTVVNFDQLRAPSSPAFNLLGISPNDIERPKNPTDFAFSVGNASNGLSTVPKSYALEMSPFWVFGGKSTFEQFIDNKNIGNNIKQTLVFSLGSTTARSVKDSAEFRQIGISVKFSILRGKVGYEFTKWDKEASKYLAEYGTFYGHIRDSLTAANQAAIDPLLKLYVQYKTTDPDKAAAILKAVQAMNDALDVKVRVLAQDTTTSKNKVWLAKLAQLSSQTAFRRYGFTMDWAAGTVIDFPDSSFNRSYLSKFATWLTFGYEWQNGNNAMFLVRYAANFNRFYRNDLNLVVKDIDIGDLDLGLRVYKDFTDKLTLSAEYITRLPFYSDATLKSNMIATPSRTDKYDFSLNYKLAKNQNISFTYGKNFDNVVTKSGNLIAAVNYMIGLGSARGLSR
ncbi:hypothetical protein [Mucilaginibacter xinganensis]|uniref:DUF5723 domain-containing protein n=1 Tax=Mucilaginibacter xinganensis TaxID=1234841 RepID=A0A223NRB0_9SPHI|nr:hypothetical protein [Mucilaginibacter xinganensis]ASU32290.1 hypothetical protein MuYL_0387 [Mucilaginibacter xinganensis]